MIIVVSVSLSFDGSTVAIGAYGNDGNGSNSGHVRIFNFDGSSWNQLGNNIEGESFDDQSGSSVSLSSDGSIVAIGASENDGNGSSSGHVRVYRMNFTSVCNSPNIEKKCNFNYRYVRKTNKTNKSTTNLPT